MRGERTRGNASTRVHRYVQDILWKVVSSFSILCLTLRQTYAGSFRERENAETMREDLGPSERVKNLKNLPSITDSEITQLTLVFKTRF